MGEKNFFAILFLAEPPHTQKLCATYSPPKTCGPKKKGVKVHILLQITSRVAIISMDEIE